jgi:5-methylcytosine-specific restriction protein A
MMARQKLTTLKPQLSKLESRVPELRSGGWRTDKMTTAERGYGAKWQRARDNYLRLHPLCVMCEAEGRVKVATVVDHRTPHRGDQVLFWDESQWQSLCATHHSSDKQRSENGSPPRRRIGPDGWPVE